MLHLNIREHREPRPEGGVVDLAEALKVAFSCSHPGTIRGRVAHEDAVLAEATHRGAPGIRRNERPGWLAAQGANLLNREAASHAAVERNVHEAVPEETEALDMAVDGEDQPRRGCAAFGCVDRMLTSGFETQNRRVLVNRHATAEACRKRSHIRGRLNDHRARHERAAGVIVRAGHALHVGGIELLVRFAEPREMPLERPQRLDAAPVSRPMIFAAGIEYILLEANFLGGFACESDGRPVELDLREVLRMDSAIALAREIVRQINHETGIAASGPPA